MIKGLRDRAIHYADVARFYGKGVAVVLVLAAFNYYLGGSNTAFKVKAKEVHNGKAV